jgi:hypothetical protein
MTQKVTAIIGKLKGIVLLYQFRKNLFWFQLLRGKIVFCIELIVMFYYTLFSFELTDTSGQ